MSKTAIRRHHTKRVKNNRKGYWGYYRSRDNKQMTPTQLGIISKTCKICNKCCNHLRDKHGPTVQELGAKQRQLRED